ncbi:MAG: hypothetical protein ACI8RW_002032, partial [Porticoccaceae bacterium]
PQPAEKVAFILPIVSSLRDSMHARQTALYCQLIRS